MSSKKAKKRDESVSDRLQKARLKLTEEERQFFPKTTSMPDPPKSNWVPSERHVAFSD